MTDITNSAMIFDRTGIAHEVQASAAVPPDRNRHGRTEAAHPVVHTKSTPIDMQTHSRYLVVAFVLAASALQAAAQPIYAPYAGPPLPSGIELQFSCISPKIALDCSE